MHASSLLSQRKSSKTSSRLIDSPLFPVKKEKKSEEKLAEASMSVAPASAAPPSDSTSTKAPEIKPRTSSITLQRQTSAKATGSDTPPVNKKPTPVAAEESSESEESTAS